MMNCLNLRIVIQLFIPLSPCVDENVRRRKSKIISTMWRKLEKMREDRIFYSSTYIMENSHPNNIVGKSFDMMMMENSQNSLEENVFALHLF